MAFPGLDRYYVPALPFLLVGIAALVPASGHPFSRAGIALALTTLALLALLSVGWTHDYLAWNRARWSAINELLASGKATPRDVNGGFEFWGWYVYNPGQKYVPGEDLRDYSGRYLITFSPKPGWKSFKEYNFSHWLPPGSGSIRLLEKEAPTAGEMPGK